MAVIQLASQRMTIEQPPTVDLTFGRGTQPAEHSPLRVEPAPQPLALLVSLWVSDFSEVKGGGGPGKAPEEG